MKIFVSFLLTIIFSVSPAIPVFGNIPSIEIDRSQIFNGGVNPLNIIEFSITNHSLSFVVDPEPGRIIDINNIIVSIQKGSWFEHATETVFIDIPLIETDWNAHSRDRYVVINANFSEITSVTLNQISLISIQDIDFYDMGQDWFNSVIVFDEDLLSVFGLWDTVPERSFESTIEMLYFLEFGQFLYEAYSPYIAPIGITRTYDGITLEIISAIALSNELYTEIITFFTLQGEYLDTEIIWDNTIVFADEHRIPITEDDETMLPWRRTNVHYIDMETEAIYFVSSQMVQTQNNETAFIDFHIVGLENDWDRTAVTPDIDILQLLADHNPVFAVPPGDLSLEFSPDGFLLWEYFNIEALGELEAGYLDIEIYPGVYITNIALLDNILYIQYRQYGGYNFLFGLEPDVADSTHLFWWPSMIHSRSFSPDGHAFYLEDVYLIYDIDGIGNLLPSLTGPGYPNFTMPLNLQAGFYVPVISEISFSLEIYIDIPMQGHVFTLSNFNFHPGMFDFDIAPGIEVYQQLLGIDMGITWSAHGNIFEPYLEIIVHFIDGTQKPLNVYWSGVGWSNTDSPVHVVKDVEIINPLDVYAFEINGVKIVL